jgi:hypothetical protein
MAIKQRNNILQKIRRRHFDYFLPKQNRWKDNSEPYEQHRQAFGIQTIGRRKQYHKLPGEALYMQAFH